LAEWFEIVRQYEVVCNLQNEHRRKDAIWNVIAEGDFYQATK